MSRPRREENMCWLLRERLLHRKLLEEETAQSALEKVRELVSKGMRGADACKEIAKASKFSKSELYSMLLEDEKNV